LVDSFLSQKLANEDAATPAPKQAPATVIHHVTSKTEVEIIAVDFVSESDVRDAVNENRKIYINAKTIVTPAARDLGTEKEVIVEV
ncbi:MAG: hypothetical protein OEM82_05050, partial [Acidobacteriota bacterium]|nr:hypothetical protein [Acidobacteriota bacterium]